MKSKGPFFPMFFAQNERTLSKLKLIQFTQKLVIFVYFLFKSYLGVIFNCTSNYFLFQC